MKCLVQSLNVPSGILTSFIDLIDLLNAPYSNYKWDLFHRLHLSGRFYYTVKHSVAGVGCVSLAVFKIKH